MQPSGTVIAGIIIFKETITFWRIFFLTTLVTSVVGLKIVSSYKYNKNELFNTKKFNDFKNVKEYY